jgi:ABC-2 type transport system permease protein
MWLLSGAFFPASGDGWLSWVVRLNPLTYGVAGLRHFLRFSPAEILPDASASAGAGPPPPIDALPSVALCWIVSLAFAAAMLALAWRLAGTRTRGDLK